MKIKHKFDINAKLRRKIKYSALSCLNKHKILQIISHILKKIVQLTIKL